MSTKNEKPTKIIGHKVVTKPCPSGDHFRAHILFNWNNGDQSETACHVCFDTKEIAEYEAAKAVPLMESALHEVAAKGLLEKNVGSMLGYTSPDPKPNNLH